MLCCCILWLLSEVEWRTQGSRPRTALPRTDPLEAKDRNARGRGQGPRTPAQVFSKKKVLKIFFSRSPKNNVCKKNFSGDPQNLNNSKYSAVLEPRTGQIFKGLRLQSQGQRLDLRGQSQGLQNVSSRTSLRTSSRTPPLVVVKALTAELSY